MKAYLTLPLFAKLAVPAGLILIAFFISNNDPADLSVEGSSEKLEESLLTVKLVESSHPGELKGEKTAARSEDRADTSPGVRGVEQRSGETTRIALGGGEIGAAQTGEVLLGLNALSEDPVPIELGNESEMESKDEPGGEAISEHIESSASEAKVEAVLGNAFGAAIQAGRLGGVVSSAGESGSSEIEVSSGAVLAQPVTVVELGDDPPVGGNSGSEEEAKEAERYPRRDNPVPLGVSTFPLAEVSFPLQDSDQADGIGYRSVASVLRRIATNQLWEQTGTTDNEQVLSVLRGFVERGQEVTHNIYVLDGPGMRRKRGQFFNSVHGSSGSPERFRKALESDSDVRDAVLNLFAEVVVFATRLEEAGVTVYITPELEDNQTEETFRILLEFLRKAGWQAPDGTLRKDRTIRNSVDGIRTQKMAKIRREYHIHSLQELNLFEIRPGDFINMDGRSFTYANQAVAPELNNTGLFSEDEVRFLINYCEEHDVVFYIWDAPLQYSNRSQPEGAHLDELTVIYDTPELIEYKLLEPERLMSMLWKVEVEEFRTMVSAMSESSVP